MTSYPSLPAPPWTVHALPQMVRDAMDLQWRSRYLHLRGPGAGLDIYGRDASGRFAGIRCCTTPILDDALAVDQMIRAAEKLPERLDILYFATTEPRDSMIEADFRTCSEGRIESHECALGLIYWDDILAGLSLSAEVYLRYFPNSLSGNLRAATPARKLAALELGYFGAGLAQYVEISQGSGDRIANHACALDQSLRLLRHRIAELAFPKDAKRALQDLTDLESRLGAAVTDEQWAAIDGLVDKLSAFVHFMPRRWPEELEAMLALGIRLGEVFLRYDIIPQALVRDIQRQVTCTVSGFHAPSVEAAFQEWREPLAGHRLARRVYVLVERIIRAGFDPNAVENVFMPCDSAS